MLRELPEGNRAHQREHCPLRQEAAGGTKPLVQHTRSDICPAGTPSNTRYISPDAPEQAVKLHKTAGVIPFTGRNVQLVLFFAPLTVSSDVKNTSSAVMVILPFDWVLGWVGRKMSGQKSMFAL